MHAAAFGLAAAAALIGSTALGAAPTPPPAPAVPCGFVTFLPTSAPHVSGGTMTERIRATVSFADGHTETATFPYLWVYPKGEQTDPWSATNLRDPNLTVAMQLPPPGTDVKTLPPIIAYVVAHTDARGFTTLANCPSHGSPQGSPLPIGRKSAFVDMPPLLRFVDESPPDSPVKILEATLSPVGAEGHRMHDLVEQCVTFENHSGRIISKVRIAFSYVTDDPKRIATVTLNHAGALVPGAVVQGVRRDPSALADALSDTSNCRVFGWPGERTVLKVSVASVSFSDGSTWPQR